VAQTFVTCPPNPNANATHPAACFTATCNPGTGQCGYTGHAGISYTDQSAGANNLCNCTCAADGSCVGSVAAQCPAPADTRCWGKNTCNGSGGCNVINQPASFACNADNNACTVGDHCDGAGNCLAGPAKVCSTPPNAQCYDAAGTCSDPVNGTCTYSMKAANSTCDDGDQCTYNDQCQPNGDCKGAQGPTCGATAACPVAGTCDGKGGCTFPADLDTKGTCAGQKAAASCTTCNPCLTGQTCDANGNCGGGSKLTNGSPCSTATCLGGVCTDGACMCMSVPDMATGSGGGGSDDMGSGSGGSSSSGCDFVPTPGSMSLFGLIFFAMVFMQLRRRLR
jgi:hypothetical protein